MIITCPPLFGTHEQDASLSKCVSVVVQDRPKCYSLGMPRSHCSAYIAVTPSLSVSRYMSNQRRSLFVSRYISNQRRSLSVSRYISNQRQSLSVSRYISNQRRSLFVSRYISNQRRSLFVSGYMSNQRRSLFVSRYVIIKPVTKARRCSLHHDFNNTTKRHMLST